MIELVGPKEKRDIGILVEKILRDLGNPEPPLNLSQVRELLKLDLSYYSSTDVSRFAEYAHKIRIAGKQLIVRPGLLLDVVKKANLSGLWLPDERRIFIDKEVPDAKHRWIEAHEIAHSITPWHADFLLGDTQFTLDPTCHATIEAEANFGAGNLIFLGSRFHEQAKAVSPTFASIKKLSRTYANSITSTFWRFVEERDPDVPAFGLISQHPRYPDIGRNADGTAICKLVVSRAFRSKFSKTSFDDLFALIRRNASWNRRGPVISGSDFLNDANGTAAAFALDGFSNTHYVLTYGRSV